MITKLCNLILSKGSSDDLLSFPCLSSMCLLTLEARICLYYASVKIRPWDRVSFVTTVWDIKTLVCEELDHVKQ